MEELRSSLAIVKTKRKSVNVVNTTVHRNQNAGKIIIILLLVSKIQEQTVPEEFLSLFLLVQS